MVIKSQKIMFSNVYSPKDKKIFKIAAYRISNFCKKATFFIHCISKLKWL
jgi:hypothetical protein